MSWGKCSSVSESQGRKPKALRGCPPVEHGTNMFRLGVMLILDNLILVIGHGLMVWVKDARQFRAGCDRHQIVDVRLSG